MERKAFLIGLLAMTLLLAQMTLVFAALATPDESIIRLDAKGGIPGKPTKPPEDPEDPPVDPQSYELFIEIDYMDGHKPTQTVLDYIVWYYDGHNPSGAQITVTFYIDDYPIPIVDDSISESEFWAIEDDYNNHDNGYYSEWKWVLFGTTVEGSSNTMGYTYVAIERKDLVAGNYIFIADKSTDDWADQYTGIAQSDAEAVVLMHELGHSIGIAKIHPAFGEQYDPNPESVMSYLSTANAGLTGDWYYSDNYWATYNMEYYIATP